MYVRQDGIDAIIIGAGPSGIAMAHSLKHKLGFDNFAVRDAILELLLLLLIRSNRSTRNWMARAVHGEQIHILDGKLMRNLDTTLLTFLLCSGCDVPTHLYSFSFNLNPDWSKELCDQEEILECELKSVF